ncbi:DNA repair protein XRCC1 [Anopheles nili]|uniref:DNA repair protein XRCC1 n=1 Tax=Anopheles nili TaxID=185578 RepID=UPI00237BB257|nr:DNA repair protein XRCC1 [Anopheles nili]
MPAVNFKSIDCFSSEDPNYPASNLLKPGNKKWKCREAGEQQAFVVIKLEEPTQISGIDIGNEHSAHIEVLVARSGPSNPSYTEILLASKFMSPVDSRNSSAPNRVQCFNTSALLPAAAKEKWDLVKIICTQPFNSRVKYGLTFVVLHTSATERKEKNLVPDKFLHKLREEATGSKAPAALNLGRFKLREESPDSDDATGCSKVFSRWKNKTDISQPADTTSSALVRNAAKLKDLPNQIPAPGSIRSAAIQRPKPVLFVDSDDEEQAGKSIANVKIHRNNESLLYDAEDDKPAGRLNASIDVARPKNQALMKVVPLTATSKANAAVKKPSKLHDVSSSKFKEFLDLTGQTSSRQEEKKSTASLSQDAKKLHNGQSNNAPKKTPDKPSSVARPPLSIERHAVSAKQLSTPSRNVTKNDDGLSLHKKPKLLDLDVDSEKEVKKNIQYKAFGRLLENVVLVISGVQNPDRGHIRNQALAMGAKYKPDWDASCTHLICAYKNTPKYNQVKGKGKIVKKDWIEKCHATRKKLSWRKFALDTEEANVTDSEDEIIDIANKPSELPPPSQDPRIVVHSEEEGNDEPVMLHDLSDSDDGGTAHRVYDVSTEDDGDGKLTEPSGGLSFFLGKKFYLHPEVGAVDIIKLEKYIKSYKGTITQNMTEADYIIARNKHTLPANCQAEQVKPLWVYECDDMECLIPVHRYRI